MPNYSFRREVNVNIDQTELLMEQRRGYLVLVDAIERHLGLERTSKMREKIRKLEQHIAQLEKESV